MAVEVAVGDELSACGLRDRGCRVVGRLPAGQDGFNHAAGEDEPAETQAGSEALRERATVDHSIGGHALERADRMAVVAVLGVVVVFDDVAVDVAGPPRERGAPRR